MAWLIGVVALVAILVWFLSPRRRAEPAPEDDVSTPVDHEELAEAERELEDDRRAGPLDQEGSDPEDDWGPGTA